MKDETPSKEYMFMKTAVICYRTFVVYIFRASQKGFCQVKGPVHFKNMSVSEEMGPDSFSFYDEPT